MITIEDVLAVATMPLTDNQVDAIIKIVSHPYLRQHLVPVVRIVEEMDL